MPIVVLGPDAQTSGRPAPSVALVIPEARIESCGVTDYAIRLGAAMTAKGVTTSILTAKGGEGRLIETPEGPVRLEPLSAETAARFDVIAVQYVPNMTPFGMEFIHQVTGLGHPRPHLMIHEFWRFPTEDHPLTLREKITGWRQRFRLTAFIRKLAPRTIGTSNRHYRELLGRAGISAKVSPMPGTVAIGINPDPPVGLEVPAWLKKEDGSFTWVIFGSLYTPFWDVETYFEQVRESLAAFPFRHRWVVCGRQAASDIEHFQKLASLHGFEGCVHFTGAISAVAVDWWVRQADASFSGTSGKFWSKSSGVLVALERGVPVYFPRGGVPSNEAALGLCNTLEELYALRSKPRTYSGDHTPAQAAEALIKFLE